MVRLQDRFLGYSELIYNRFFQPKIFGPRDPGLTELRTHIWSRVVLGRKWRKTVPVNFENRPHTADTFWAKFRCWDSHLHDARSKNHCYLARRPPTHGMALANLRAKNPADRGPQVPRYSISGPQSHCSFIRFSEGRIIRSGSGQRPPANGPICQRASHHHSRACF